MVARAAASGTRSPPKTMVGRSTMSVIATDQVVFVVHATNPVRALTRAQLRDIHSGRVTNWSEVGGPDRAIKVVTDTPSSATRGLIKQAVLKDVDYTPAALAVKVEDRPDLPVGPALIATIVVVAIPFLVLVVAILLAAAVVVGQRHGRSGRDGQGENGGQNTFHVAPFCSSLRNPASS